MNNHTLNIENNSGAQNFDVALFDLQGSLKFQQTAEGKLTQIEIPIAPGMYLIRVLSDKGTNSRKIIIR